MTSILIIPRIPLLVVEITIIVMMITTMIMKTKCYKLSNNFSLQHSMKPSSFSTIPISIPSYFSTIHQFNHRQYSILFSTSRNRERSMDNVNGGKPKNIVSKNRSSSFSPRNRKFTDTARAKTERSSDSNNNNNNNSNQIEAEGIRINKCLPSLSRRGADDAISEGRVTINGEIVKPGTRAVYGDIIRLDGKIQKWETMAMAKESRPSTSLEEREFVYLKYWKPRDVTCTSNLNEKTNIITAGRFHLFPQRLFTVGRLDKDSTGLILLTSDGRVNNAILSPSMNKEKVYEVTYNMIPTDEQMEQLRSGVVISTPIQRDGTSKMITAKTLPCRVKRVNSGKNNSDLKYKSLEITLMEGRNRQIRRMAEAVGLKVVDLHRISFCGINLKGLSEGNWSELNEKEMESILKALDSKDASIKSSKEVLDHDNNNNDNGDDGDDDIDPYE